MLDEVGLGSRGVPNYVETIVASFHFKEKPAALEWAFEKWAE